MYPCCLTFQYLVLEMRVQCAIMYFYVDLGTAIVSFFMRMLPPLSAVQLLLLFTYYCDSAPTSQIKLVKSDVCCMLQLFLFPW